MLDLGAIRKQYDELQDYSTAYKMQQMIDRIPALVAELEQAQAEIGRLKTKLDDCGVHDVWPGPLQG